MVMKLNCHIGKAAAMMVRNDRLQHLQCSRQVLMGTKID